MVTSTHERFGTTFPWASASPARLAVTNEHDGLRRRDRSEARLRALGLEPPENDVPSVEPTRWMRTEEVLKRALCLVVIGMYGEGLDTDSTRLQVDLWRLEDSLSPDERQALQAGELPYNDAVALSWQTEAAIALLWSLGLVERLDEAWDPELAPALRDRLFAAERFEDALALVRWRSAADVADEGDYYARYYALYERASQQNSEGAPGVDAPMLGHQPAEVVAARWRAFRWLASAATWDDLAPDVSPPS
jgi:Domain of unknown function (DUF4272)